MRSIPSKKDKKIELGKRTNEGYEYGAKIDLGQDLSAQISMVLKEKETNETIEEKVKELEEVIKEFPRKGKNITYYYEVGKKLLFLDSDSFKNIAPNSVFRRIVEELPEILPDTDVENKQSKKNACRHIGVMYELAHVGKNELSKASWDQWYEIGKFSGICEDKKLLEQILTVCEKEGLSGIGLRERIREFRRSKRVSPAKNV
jgi:hypothetical protein